jgi:hypothetical protein
MVSLVPWAVAVVFRLRRLKCRPVVLKWPRPSLALCGLWEDGDSDPISELASSLPSSVDGPAVDVRHGELSA